MDPFFGSLLNAGSSLLGGLFGQNSQEDMFDKQMDLQRDMATHGIEWKVADAKRSGIHPIYALGAPPFNFSPIGLGSNPLGEGIANAGSALAQGISNRASPEEKALAALQLQRAGLENDLLRVQIRNANSPGSVGGNPAIPGSTIGTKKSVVPDDTLELPLGMKLKPRDPMGGQKAQNAFDQALALLFGTYYGIRDIDEQVGPQFDTLAKRMFSDALKRVIGGPDAPIYPGQ